VNEDVKKALNIASAELRSCYTKEGIIAGKHHFTDYWARDGYFASLGSLAIGDKSVVINMVNLFYKFQRKDGLIPYRIMRGPVTLGKYLGHPKYFDKPKPTYHLRGIGKEVLDGTTLTLLLTGILGSRAWKDAKICLPKVKIALEYLASREKHNLLWDGVMAEWNDTALKFGNLLYSNVIYWYMMDHLSIWIKDFDRVWGAQLDLKKDLIAKAIKERLWNGKYFADWYDYKRQDYFYPFGNCLAIAWGLTNKEESESIIKECKKVKVDFTLETNSPKYPWWRIDVFQHLVGMGDYQNISLLWWQPVTSYLSALKKLGKQTEANRITTIITQKIVKDGLIYECYDRSGLPLNRKFFRSECPFAWSSGMLLWALTFPTS
jgi:glycogen debranching enzyme